MAVQCPRCGKPEIKTRHGLRKHLSGGAASGGHDVPFEVADLEATVVWEGGPLVVTAPAVMPAEVIEAMTALSDSSAPHYLRVLLATLVADKQLPKYQFERRIDALLTPCPCSPVDTLRRPGETRVPDDAWPNPKAP